MTTSTWSSRATTGEWNTASNWDPDVVPTDAAVFAESSQTKITFSPTSTATVKSIEFSAGASAYTFVFAPSSAPALTIDGPGVINHSAADQHFVVAATSTGYDDPQLEFSSAAIAGGSNVHYTAGPITKEGSGGGVISFHHTSSAGSARFKAWTGAAAPPRENSTVGGEISFRDSSTAATADFTIYGTLGADGDTFGNAAFHDESTAASATFTNMGGTVSGGDGGNTQFFENSTAAEAVFYNKGGTCYKANGGDVAFDGTADGGNGRFHNYAATAVCANGGVTSFNNNPPASAGASAGRGLYLNYGASVNGQGGGHTEFTAKYGSPTAGNGSFHNFGCSFGCPQGTGDASSAGHTIFSIEQPTDYAPTAGNGVFWNHPGTAEGAPGGFTEFAVYDSSKDGKSGGPAVREGDKVPAAGSGTFLNLGATVSGAFGGYTSFGDTTTAGNAQLVATGGINGGHGGRIEFSDEATGGEAEVLLFGNGVLDLGDHTGGVTMAALEMTGGVIEMQLGSNLTNLTLTERLTLNSSVATFEFWTKDRGGFEAGTPYTILAAPNLSDFQVEQFSGNSVNGTSPTFTIVGDTLQVTFQPA
jgi:hypothetical protein